MNHGRDKDWNNDPDNVRNIVGVVWRDWKTLVNWQVLDPDIASVSELLQAPIVYFNGHQSPNFSQLACERLRKYVEKGGFIFAEACCGSREFDEGFKQLIKRIFPEDEYTLRPLSADHPIWRAKHPLTPDQHSLWGIDNGRRAVVIYSPQDLSCYWNQAAEPCESGRREFDQDRAERDRPCDQSHAASRQTYRTKGIEGYPHGQGTETCTATAHRRRS